MTKPDSLTAALQQVDRAAYQSKVLSAIFVIIACVAPIGLFFTAKGQPMVNIALICLTVYNSLLIFWLKRDMGQNTALILRALEAVDKSA